ncbi:MAG TPA: hypothetical protein VIK49_05715 [Steroidobacteraceae bacterium]
MRDAGTDARVLRRMKDAARHVALYRRLWGAAASDFDPERVPRLDKAALRACPAEDRIDDRRLGRKLRIELSSGSSGEPMAVYTDRAAHAARRWAFLRALWACGYRPGQPFLLLTSRREARSLAMARWHYASIADDTETLARRVTGLAPRVLYGPLSTLELLAEWFAARPQQRPALSLVVSTAEQLTPGRRARLERGLGAPAADFYGLTEFGLVAYRPPGSAAFVPARRSLVLEFLALPGDPAGERLIVTDLAERTSPLIRYETGDFVRRDAGAAGRPIIEFSGRSMDCLVQPDRSLVSPYRIDVALERIPGLRGYEVVQRPDCSIDVTLETAAADADRVGGLVRQTLASVLGAALPVRIEAGTIRRGPPGAKFRPIRSHVARGT